MKEQYFIYSGFWDVDAEAFFKGHYIMEERNGGTAVGTFIILSNGTTMLPMKGDRFIKDENGINYLGTWNVKVDIGIKSILI